jgi:hypothetical protein
MAIMTVWPDGVCDEIAVIDVDVSEAEKLFSVKFAEDCDDLDIFKYAVLESSGRPFVLQRYKNRPNNGVVVITSRVSQEELSGVLSSFLDAFAIPKSRLTWVRPCPPP